MFNSLFAAMNGVSIPFEEGSSFSYETNHTIKFTLDIDYGNMVARSTGWHPHFLASYSFPEGTSSLPPIIITAVDFESNPITDFGSTHTLKASLISDDLNGRVSISAISPVQLSLQDMGNGKFKVSGSFPSKRSWLKLSLLVDNIQEIDLPLFPYGYPIFLSTNLAIATPDFAITPFTSTCSFIPYLAASATSSEVINPTYILDSTKLYAGLPEDEFFVNPTPERERYNAAILSQNSQTICFLQPHFSNSELFFNALEGYTQGFYPTQPLTLSYNISAPVFLNSGNSMSVNLSRYDFTSKTWITSLALQG